MTDTDSRDEPSSASAPETHDTSSDDSSDSSASQVDTPSQTESLVSQETREPWGADTQEEPSVSESGSQPSTPSSSASPDAPPTLDQARTFLRDPAVLRETPARKAAFLAAKGLSGSEIDILLKEVADEEQPQAQESTAAAAPSAPATLPPIVTYPEFANSSPQPPPPLVTPQVLAAALYGTAATSSLLYAAAKLVLAPMVDALTDARSELHETAGSNLAVLTEKLQGIVSVVPPSLSAAADKQDDVKEVEIDDASSASSYDDPTEVFHRDIGVQTSLPQSPVLPPSVTMDSTVPNLATGLSPASTPVPTASQLQADRLASLVESVRTLSQGWVGSTDLHTEIKTTVEVFRDDVDKLSRPPAFTYGGGSSGGMYNYGSAISSAGSSGTSGTKYPGYVTTTRNEPDDEIRKAKENIRRVKGALLSTRTFPTAR